MDLDQVPKRNEKIEMKYFYSNIITTSDANISIK
jgi:hypothetical protein